LERVHRSRAKIWTNSPAGNQLGPFCFSRTPVWRNHKSIFVIFRPRGKSVQAADLQATCISSPVTTSSAMSNSEVPSGDKCAAFPSFVERHVGPSSEDIRAMLGQIGYDSLESLIDATIPEKLRFRKTLALPEGETEFEVLRKLRVISLKNRLAKSYIGLGYQGCITPPAIQRHILENAGWYTAYTPYQAEIAQGRLEALVNFQTLVTDLTGLEIANASLLDEGTAAAESMAM